MSAAATVSQWEKLPHAFAQVSDGIRLHYVDTGVHTPASSTSVPVVLLHGWPDIGFGWRHQLAPLAAKYRVIVPDMRGFGQSSSPAEASAYGSKNVTTELARLLDVLEIDKAVFIGHDFGATMSWRMCLYYPERVAAVCSVDIPYYPPSDQCTDVDALVAMLPQFAYLKLLGDSEATADKLAKAPRRFFNAVFHHTAAIPGDLKRLIETLEDGSDARYTEPSALLSVEELDYYVYQVSRTTHGFLGGCHYYRQWQRDFETELALPRAIPHEALYVATTRSKVDDTAQQQTVAGMAQVIPKLETKVVHEAGLWDLWEKKEEITATLLAWLERVNYM